MSQQNPYLNVYFNSLNHLKIQASKDQLYTLAVNLGQVHNVLGIMISDIVNMMGNLSMNEQKEQSFHGQVALKGKITRQDSIGVKQKNQLKQTTVNAFRKSNQCIPEKMQIENLPINQFNDAVKSQQVIKKCFDLNQFQFKEQKQQKQANYQPIRKSIFTDLLFQTDRNESDHHQTKKMHHQSEQSISSKTESAQRVRYNQSVMKLADTKSFQQLSQYASNIEQKNVYKVKIKDVQIKQQQKRPKKKSPFFDLFDSSQTNSNLQDSDDIAKFSPIIQQRKFQEKNYPQTQVIGDMYYFERQKEIVFPSQIKINKPSNMIKNSFTKTDNLLQQSFSVGSPRQQLHDVEEIDQIETTHKKLICRTLNKKKNQEKQQKQQFDEYVPRRDEIGRKKIDRQGVKGSQCPDCRAFYEAISEDGKSFIDVCECTSRHKSSTTFMKKHKVQDYSQAFDLD